MKALKKIKAIVSALRRPKQVWYPISSIPTRANIVITPEQALRLSAVIACVKVISESLSTLPLHVYRRLDSDAKERAPDHSLYNLLHTRPNAWQTPVDFFEFMQGCLCLRGNAYAEIKYDQSDYRPAALMPLNPDRVIVERVSDDRLVYVVRDEVGKERKVAMEDMHHVRGFSTDGVKGLSPIAQAAESVGISLAAERLSAAFFRNGTVLNVALEHPENLSEPALAHLKKSISDEYGGADNAYKPYILEEGMKWHDLGVKPDEGQFLETRKFHVTDICRIFRVPPHMIADLEHATFSNIEHQDLGFVKHTLRPWLVRWEQSMQRDLFAQEDTDHFAEFSIDGILRGDSRARAQSFKMQFENGVLSRNEWRRFENRNPVPGGDDYYVPLNLGIAGRTQRPQDDTSNQNALAGWIESTADRIVAAETRAIERWLSKAAHSKTWTIWIADFYSKHVCYIQDSVQPIADIFGKRAVAAEIASAAAQAAIERYSKMQPAAARAHAQHCRYRELRDLICQWLPETKNVFGK
jgi:HK97 family phage portal protein